MVAVLQPESHKPHSFVIHPSEVRKGEKVYLRDAGKVAEEIIDHITELMYGDNALKLKSKIFRLKELLKLDIFAEEFIERDGMSVLVNIVTKNQEANTASYGLQALSKTMIFLSGLEYVASRPEVIEKLTLLTYHPRINLCREAMGLMLVVCKIHQDGFGLIDSAVRKVDATKSMELKEHHPPYSQIIKHVENDDLDLKNNSLALLTVIIEKATTNETRVELLHSWGFQGLLGAVSSQMNRVHQAEFQMLATGLMTMTNDLGLDRNYLKVRKLHYLKDKTDAEMADLSEWLESYREHLDFVDELFSNLKLFRAGMRKLVERGVPINVGLTSSRHNRYKFDIHQLVDLSTTRDNFKEDMQKFLVWMKQHSRQHALYIQSEKKGLSKKIMQNQNLEMKLEKLEAELKGKITEYDAQEAKLAPLRQKFQGIVKRQSDAESELNSLKAKVEEQQTKKSQAEANLKNLSEDDELKELNENILLLSTKEEDSAKKLSAEIETLKKKIEELKKKASTLTSPPPVSAGVPAPPMTGLGPPPVGAGLLPPPPGLGGPVGLAPPPGGLGPPPTGGILGPPPGLGAPMAVKKPSKRGMTKPKTKPKKKMNALHWKRILIDQMLDQSSEETLWRVLNSFQVDFDEEEFVTLFTSEKKKTKGKGKEGKKRQDNQKKRVDIRVLDNKTSQSVAIMMKSLPSIEQTYYAIIKMDKEELNEDKLTKIIANLPKPEELALIRAEEKKDPLARFDKPERYFKTISKIPVLALRLRIWKFSYTVGESIKFHTDRLVIMQKACTELCQSKALLQAIQVVLSVGNYMNGKTRRGQADGFHMSLLSKIKDTKSSDGKTTLIDFIAMMCKRSNPGLKDALAKEMEFMLRSNEVPEWKELNAGAGAIDGQFKTNTKNVETVRKATERASEDIKKADRFQVVMEEFLKETKKKVNTMLFERKQALTAFKEAVSFFGTGLEDKVEIPKSSQEFLKPFRTFTADLIKAWPVDEKKENDAAAGEGGAKRGALRGITGKKTFGGSLEKSKKLGAKAMINALKRGVPKLRQIKKKRNG